MLGEMRMYWRFARDLRRFLKEPITLEQSQKIIKHRLENRENNLLTIVKSAIYGNKNSPYLKLLRIAGCEYGDFKKMICSNGIENTLKILCDNGVYVSIEEFKGRKPVNRGAKSWSFTERDFDNPFLFAHMQASSSGSRSAGTRSLYDLDFIASNISVYNLPMFHSLGALKLPIALWMPAIPGAGVINLLAYTKGGNTLEKWFSPLESQTSKPSLKNRLAVSYIINMGRLAGVKWPLPEYIAYDNAVAVARWIAETTKRAGGCVLDTYVSAILRVCHAAKENGIDISGAVFVMGGEPLTEVKLKEIKSVGAKYCIGYGISEAGFVGANCLNPSHPDDIHFFEDSFALIQNRRAIEHVDVEVDAFLITSLLPSTPKVLLNMETGDYGFVETRSCNCLFNTLGFKKHIHHIRGFDRLTSEGMNFFSGDLVRIIEEDLPANFGGSSTDYQIVEEENEQGMTRLCLVVSPELGIIDEESLVQTVLAKLAEGTDAERMMAQVWSQAKTLYVKRMKPITTVTGKLLPLHIQKVKNNINQHKMKQPEHQDQNEPP